MPFTTDSTTDISAQIPFSHASSAPFLPTDVTSRKQPWKKYWPPKDGTDKEKAYGFSKGAVIVIFGN